MKLITTSWDDGHELDGRLADLLCKYGLQGTFYIPQSNNEHPVMPLAQMRQLATHFEIGGHTMHHTRLAISDLSLMEAEIRDCFSWLSGVLGNSPVSFCFPGGKFHHAAITAVFRNGFKVARTTELLSTCLTASHQLMPTTLQVFPHNGFTYGRHLVRRGKWNNLSRWLSSHSLYNLEKLSLEYLQHIDRYQGCFHLWGHSWEIEEYGLWQRLENIFRILSGHPEFRYVQNGQIINYN